MTRGQRSDIGATRTSPNGYHYTRTEEGWQLTHKIVAEEQLGRELEDNERIRFKDGNRQNLTPDNIEVYITKQGSSAKRLAVIDAKIADLQAKRAEIMAESDES